MFKNTVALVMLGSLITTASFASSFFNKLKITAKPSAMQTAVNIKDNKKYTDFSGVWIGKCSHTDEEFTTTISNDAYTISFDDDEITIGDLTTEASSGRAGTTFSHDVLYWNSDRTVLLINSIYLDKVGSNQIFNANLRGSMSLNNGQIIISGKVDASQNQQSDSLDVQCTLNKSQ